MKVSLILEAINKASGPIQAAQKAVAGANTAAQKGAQAVAKAYDAVAKAGAAVGKGAQAVGNAMSASAQKASRAYQGLRGVMQSVAGAATQLKNTVSASIANTQARLSGMWQKTKNILMLGAGAGAAGGAAGFIANQIMAPLREREQILLRLERVEGAQRQKVGKKMMPVSPGQANAAAEAGMAWARAQSGNFTPRQSLDAYATLREAGLKPTEAMYKSLNDAAIANKTTFVEAAGAMAKAWQGDTDALEAYGVEIEKLGKYNKYAFKGADGQDYWYKARANDAAANQQAIQKALNAKNGGAADRYNKTFDGQMDMLKLKASNAWDNFQDKIARSGLFDVFKIKINDISKALDNLEKSQVVADLAQGISDGLGEAMRIGWEVAQGFITALKVLGDTLKWLDANVVSFKTMAMLMVAIPIASTVIGWVTAIYGVAKAVVTMNLAFMASPIFWVIAAIAAFAAAAYLVYKNWDKIGPYFWQLWGQVKAAATAAWSYITSVLSNAWAGIKGAASAAWEGIKAALSAAWEGIKGAASAAWDGIKAAISASWDGIKTLFGWTPLGLIVNNWNEITAFFGKWGGAALAEVQKAFETIQAWVEGAVGKISKVFGKISEGAKAAWSFAFGDSGAAQKTLADGLTADPAQLAAVEAATAGIKENMQAIGGTNTSKALADVGAISDDAVKAAEAIGRLTSAARAAVDGVKSYLGSVDLSSYGVRFMTTLASGIRAGAGQAVGAVREVAQQMRDHLPHSPAKTGPLSDLHQIKFSETLARAITPGPAVAAVRMVAAGMAAALPLSFNVPAMAAPLSDGVPVNARGAGSDGSGAGGAPVTLNYSPSVTIQGGDAGAQDKFAAMLREHADVINRIVNDALRNKERVSY